MAKQKTAYVCGSCGYDSPKWIGKCPACGEWNTFKEVKLGTKAGPAAREVPFSGGTAGELITMSQIQTGDEPRINLHDDELNRVLGGGLVPGSLTLLGGEPGIGKSTLILQTVLRLPELRVLYVSGEESARQLKLRADRIAETSQSQVQVACESMIEAVMKHIESVGPDLVVIDSIQTMATENVESSPGSVSQIRECAAMLLKFAKESGTPVIVIGHITKDGAIAGPKILEHMVDTVLQFEGDQHYMYRIVRAIKNRFGSTAELAIYEMQSTGLRPVANPSELLLSDIDQSEGLSGVAIACAIEGVRPLLIETQSLVSTAAYGTPQRSATGFDMRRLNMLLAVLEKRVGFKLAQKDVYLNIAGGLRVTDPAIDLSIIAAVLSSNVDTPVDRTTCLCGEVGLSGEIRPVSRILQRISEAERLGFQRIIIPNANLQGLDTSQFSIDVRPVRKVEEALRELFG
jgi:DNA repair protein RadA/Sms